MFGHKSFLKIGPLEDASISGLYRSSYELDECNFSFTQGVDANGKAQTEVRGGTLHLTYGNVPPQEIIKWMLDSRKYEDGVIVVCDDNDMPLEKIHFEQAACTGLDISYTQQGKGYTSARITLQAKVIKVGVTTLESRWV